LDERDKQLSDIKSQLREWMDTANTLIHSQADFKEKYDYLFEENNRGIERERGNFEKEKDRLNA
jgi:hypothetical protein